MSTSSGDLPDEIIREILFPALRVPDEVFRSMEAISPFSSYSESTSAYLLVCKSWLRVATPLLYNVVVLRSKAQAQALESALRGNALLGTFIQKLRVEGGLGPSMHGVFRLAPNIAEICLPLHIWSSDNVNGLCRGLPLANPRRLIIFKDQVERPSNNAVTQKLVNVLCECLRKWDNLSSVNLPFDALPNIRPNVILDLLDALSKVKPLKIVTLSQPQYDLDLLKSIARNRTLDTIRITLPQRAKSSGRLSGGELHAKRIFLKDERLKDLVCYDCDLVSNEEMCDVDELPHDGEEITLSYKFDPSFVALMYVPEAVKTSIWNNIIFFSLLSTDPKVAALCAEAEVSLEHANKLLRSNILLVSKQFYDLAMRHYYRDHLIDGWTSVERIRHHLSRDPSLGHVMHSLAFFRGYSKIEESFHQIISAATNLVHLTNKRWTNQIPSFNYNTLTALATKAGSTLQTLSGHSINIAQGTSPQSPKPLYAFTVLRVLEWDTPAILKFNPSEVPIDALSCLESLTVRSGNDTFLQLLGHMKLPALRHVAFPAAKSMFGAYGFLEKHGAKIDTLDMEDAKKCWDLCPSLSIMSLSGKPIFEEHATLKKIILSKLIGRGILIKSEFEALGSVNFRTEYPALVEIQAYACQWPITEHEIEKGHKSWWVKWSERLMEWNVKLTDKDGKHWKPRLK
ncbi:hypothetical protein DXG01_011106 [Tephrocybe rancida]|nr:hypothetical protein DXG01_011106 [Tephrocybe rancida]